MYRPSATSTYVGYSFLIAVNFEFLTVLSEMKFLFAPVSINIPAISQLIDPSIIIGKFCSSFIKYLGVVVVVLDLDCSNPFAYLVFDSRSAF